MQTQAIAEALGGRKVLGRPVRNAGELAGFVRGGIPAVAIPALAANLKVSNSDLSRTLGIPQRTLSRRISRAAALTPAESDRTVRAARVYTRAVEMIGDREKAVAWLATPNRALGGETPLERLDTDLGARLVEDILGRIAYGVYS
jgi:putative toxin-antitoxin system antitoxin component (TIGR02293 family)